MKFRRHRQRSFSDKWKPIEPQLNIDDGNDDRDICKDGIY